MLRDLRFIAGGAAAIALASAVLVSTRAQAGGPARAGSAPAVGSAVDLASFGPLQIHFAAEAPGAGIVSQSDAVGIALGHTFGVVDSSGQVLAGVQINAEYGSFSDDQQAVQQAGSSQQTLVYQNVPAWMVTFSGTTVGAPEIGVVPPQNAPGDVIPHSRVALSQSPSNSPNTEAVVVDATTGAFIETLD